MTENTQPATSSTTPPMPQPAKFYNVRALWRGEMSLALAFWLWGFVGGIGQVVALSALLLALADAPEGAVGWVLLGWIGSLYVYFTLTFTGIWRAASRVSDKSHANAARVMVILGVLLALGITFQVVFMMGSPH